MINLASSWSIINTLRFRSTRVTWDGLRPSMEYKSCIHTYTVYNALKALVQKRCLYLWIWNPHFQLLQSNGALKAVSRMKMLIFTFLWFYWKLAGQVNSFQWWTPVPHATTIFNCHSGKWHTNDGILMMSRVWSLIYALQILSEMQESERGSWHIPTVTGDDLETPRQWICATRIKDLKLNWGR